MAGPAGPADGIDLPAAVHLQMRVDASRSHPDEQVLAPTDDLVDHPPGQVNGGVARNADIAAGQHFSGQRLPQDHGGVPDGIALGHGLFEHELPRRRRRGPIRRRKSPSSPVPVRPADGGA